MEDLFCPYCGDELSTPYEIHDIEQYFKIIGKWPHWDDENKFDEY